MSAETAALLREARAVIADPRDWCQGIAHYPSCARCAALAVCKAGGSLLSHPSPGAQRKAVDDAIVALRRAINTDNVATWNDAPGRTHAEVIAAFDVAIAAEELS